MSAEREIQAAFAAAGGQPCILCGGRGSIVGVFVPGPAANDRLGAPAGKTRTVFYSLCEKCFAHGNAAEMAEAEIAARVAH